ncbi:hypothetical protein [Nevskia ramosa]|uniref:hypothetical protein n=1 Tax=Nevskia ramosa TaxID=64002 RepID=UPI003D0ADAF5
MMCIPIYSRWLTVAIVIEGWRDLIKFGGGKVNICAGGRPVAHGYFMAIGPLRITPAWPIPSPIWRARGELAWSAIQTLAAVVALVSMIGLVHERNELRQTVRALVQYCPAAST